MTTTYAVVKPPVFEGKAGEAYVLWEMKFKAYAQDRGFAEALKSTIKLPDKEAEARTLDPAVDGNQDKIDGVEMNAKAIRALIGAFKKPRDMNRIMSEQRRDPSDWPTGKAYMVWAVVQKEYQPDDATSEADMERALMKIKLTKKMNPMQLLDDIAAVECRYSKSVTEDKRRAIVMNAGGKEYNVVLCAANMLYKTTASRNATAEELCSEMKSAWRLAGNDEESRAVGTSDDDDDGVETALAGSFKGKCHRCNKRGHRRSDCPEKGKGKAGGGEKAAASVEHKGGVKCGHCDKPGHKESECWKKHPEKVPEWIKEKRKNRSGGETSASATEVLVCTIGCKEEEELIECEEMDAVLSLDAPRINYSEDAYPTDLEMLNEDDVVEFPPTEVMMRKVTCNTNLERWSHDELEDTNDGTILDDNKDLFILDIDGMQESDDDDVEYGLTGSEQLSFPTDISFLKNPNCWLGDTGASGHCTNSAVGGKNVRDGGITLTGISGGTVKSTQEMDIPCTHVDRFGNNEKKMIFKDVSYLKHANYNLCSISKMLQEGWHLTGNKEGLYMRRDEDEIRFDIVIKTAKGALYCGYFARNEHELAAVGTTPHTQVHINVKRAHQILGHCNEEATRKTAAYFGWEITRGTLRAAPCEDCALAKAQQKAVPKVSQGAKTMEPNGRWYHDQSQLKPPADLPGTKTTWHISVDERTKVEVSGFYTAKNKFIEPFCKRVQQQKARGKPVKIIRMDNAGENKALQERMTSADWKLDCKFEFTARNTPQQNSLAEQSFRSIAAKARACLNGANVPRKWRWILFPEAAMTVTKLNWLQILELDGVAKTRIEHYGYDVPGFAKHLRTWGEAGTIKLAKVNKVDNYGVTCIFIGYANHHEGCCYRMWDPTTNRVHETRDVIWLHRMYWTTKNTAAEKTEPAVYLDGVEDETQEVDVEVVTDDESIAEEWEGDTQDDNVTSTVEVVPDSSETDSEGFTKVTTRSGRTIKNKGRYEPESGKTIRWNLSAVTNYYDSLQEIIDEDEMETQLEVMTAFTELLNVGAGLGGGFDNTMELRPMTYDEAMSGPDAERWAEEVDNEHSRMVKNVVWKAVPRSELPKGTKTIDTAWAMKKKSDGTYRGRVNARGFKQVEGVHYDGTSIHSPVTNAVTIRIILTIMLMAYWVGHLTDVHGAFLHGLFGSTEQKVYLEVPKGMKKHYPGDVVLLLLKCIYGLKQAAMAFWKELLKCMRSMGMTRSTADPCLYFKWTDNGLVMLASWIDDNLIIGNEKAVANVKKDLMSRFECDNCGEIKEYVGCKIERKGRTLKFTQPVLLQSLSDEFKLPTRSYSTPAIGGSVLEPGTEAERLRVEQATKYRSGVGKLMHMMQYSRPEIYNAVRDLARHMKNPTQVHFDAMLRTMKYLVESPERGLTLKPEGEWDGSKDYLFNVTGRSDSDYAKCKVTRKSISGYRVMLNGAPVSFKSATQKRTAQSVCEAELYAAFACAQEMLYVKHVIESLGLKVKLPMMLESDNKGAVDHTNSWSVGGHMRHVGTKQVFLRELKEDGVINMSWIPSEENDADMFTKNLEGPLFKKFARVYLGDEETSSQAHEQEG